MTLDQLGPAPLIAAILAGPLAKAGALVVSEIERFEPLAFACLAKDLSDTSSELKSWHQYVHDHRDQSGSK